MKPETKTKLKYRLRWVVWALMGWLVLRGAVSVLQGPGQTATAQSVPQTDPAEREEAKTFAALFAREYLTWDYTAAAGVSERSKRLEPYTNLESAGMAPTATRIQTASFARAWSVQRVAANRSVVTVAVEVTSPAPEPPAIPTTPVPAQPPASKDKPQPVEPQPVQAVPKQPATRRLIYLAVPVAYSNGRYVVPEYPAFVPPPAKGAAAELRPNGESMTDKDNQMQALLTGFFKAMMGGTDAEISAYMAPGATPPAGFGGTVAFREIQDLQLYRPKAADAKAAAKPVDVQAVATVNVQDPLTQGVFRQRYHLTLAQRDGRWYVTAVEPNHIESH